MLRWECSEKGLKARSSDRFMPPPKKNKHNEYWYVWRVTPGIPTGKLQNASHLILSRFNTYLMLQQISRLQGRLTQQERHSNEGMLPWAFQKPTLGISPQPKGRCKCGDATFLLDIFDHFDLRFQDLPLRLEQFTSEKNRQKIRGLKPIIHYCCIRYYVDTCSEIR